MFHVTLLTLCRNTALLALIYLVNSVPLLNCAPLNKTLDSAGRENHRNLIHAVNDMPNKSVLKPVVARKDDELPGLLEQTQVKAAKQEHSSPDPGPQHLRPIAADHEKDLLWVTQLHVCSLVIVLAVLVLSFISTI